MEPVIKSLIVKRFRSIPSEKVDFDNPTFLVGQNGSGKSNLIDALAFLAEAMTLPLQAVLKKRRGISAVKNKTRGRNQPPNLGIGVRFGALNTRTARGRYAFEVRSLPNHGFEVVREQCLIEGNEQGPLWFDRKAKTGFQSNLTDLKPSPDPASLALPVVGGDARFASVLKTLAGMQRYAIEPGRLREMQDPDSGLTLRPDGGNAASVLQEIERQSPDDAARICEFLAAIVPNTSRVRPVKRGHNLTLEFTQEWNGAPPLRFDASSMSDGTLRAVGLLAAVYQRPTPSLLAIEEPEATIHPGALGAILDLLRHASKQMQVIVTTHSPEVLEAEWIEDRHLRMVDWQEGATRVGPISDASREALRQHLMGAGELLRSNALDPQPLFEEAKGFRDDSLFEELPR